MKTRYMSVVMLSTIMASCASKESGSKTDDNTPLQTEQKTEQVAQAAVEETKKEVFTTPDLTFAGLKGHVRKCTEYPSDPPYNSFTFDKAGNITQITESYAQVLKIQRDDTGHIFHINKVDGINRSYTIDYMYNIDGTVDKQSCDAQPDGLAHEFNFTYDEEGRVTSAKGWSDGPGKLEYRYEYTKADSVGNWTERKRTLLMEGEEPITMTEERVIEYY